MRREGGRGGGKNDVPEICEEGTPGQGEMHDNDEAFGGGTREATTAGEKGGGGGGGAVVFLFRE